MFRNAFITINDNSQFYSYSSFLYISKKYIALATKM